MSLKLSQTDPNKPQNGPKIGPPSDYNETLLLNVLKKLRNESCNTKILKLETCTLKTPINGILLQ